MADGQGADSPEADTSQSARHRGSPAWRAAKALAKVAFVAGILAWLIHQDRLRVSDLGELRHGWIWAVYAFLLFLPAFFLCALRFRLLLAALQLPGTLRQAFSWTMIGCFFDLAMPLSNGGDLVKAYYVAQHAGRGKRSVAVLSVVLDRVVGLLALFVFAWLVCLVAGRQVDDNPDLLRLSRILLVVCAGSVILFFVLVSPMLERSALRKRLMHALPYHAKFEALYVAFAGLRRHVGVLVLMMVLSLVVQVLGCTGILCLAQGLSFTDMATGQPAELQLLPTLVVLPLAVFVNTFGVAGGFGAGEWAFDWLFGLMLGVRGGAALALAFHGLIVLTRLLGIPFVVLYRQEAHTPSVRAAAMEMEETLPEGG